MTEKNLEGKAIAVTGGGFGLGRAYVMELARQGANVIVNDVLAERAESVAAEARAVGAGEAAVVVGSVSDWDLAAQLTASCVKAFGTLDGLVNNAGVLHNSLPWEETEVGVRRAVDVNILGAMFCGIHALKYMVARGQGSVVNIVSGTLVGASALTTYGMTKAAVASMVHGWSLEVGDSGVRVNGVMPMAVTGMTQVRDTWIQESQSTVAVRQANQPPERVAPLVAYLLSDRSRPLNGSIVRHDGTRITIATRPSWNGGYLLKSDAQLSFDEVAAIVEGLAAG